ncbi:ABC transporter permease [Shinella yambaruensis]|uniref:ABC transporter permease n=1 Tax=Shinella yambaruensis TaxID=415996 RepID=UPI003D7A8724
MTHAALPGAPRGALRALIRVFNVNKTSWVGLAILLAVIVIAVFAPLFTAHDPLAQDVTHQLSGPSAEHVFGTDEYGRDTWARLIYGARVSLAVGIASTVIAMLVGSAIGLLAGWYGGRFDAVMMQVMDVLLAFPSLILGLVIVAMLGATTPNIVLAIALTSIPPFARIARAPTIALKEREYVEACRSLGYSDARILLVHILPNIAAEIVVMGSLWLANAIRTEASLAFIGLGIKPPTPTWGGMIRSGFENILDSAWLAVVPSLAILIVIFALNLLGDGLRDAVDPKLKNEV